jgi:phosphopantothenoylcysteine decarboxylase/phosphopantothenate--cysteine ligase
MVEPVELMGHIRMTLGMDGKLSGKKIVVTAGGTQEPLDPVRMLSNKSSGKQGYAIAQAALDAGGNVVLITALTSLTSPVGARVIQVRTAQEMQEVVLAEAKGAEALVMAAAVADFRPKVVAKSKLKKRDGIPQVELEAAPDILLAVAGMKSRKPRVVIGFAAESKNLIENASRKLKSKKLDILVANDISAPDAGFSVDTNRVTLLFPNAKEEALPLMSKSEVAEIIITHLGELLEN